MFIIAAAALTLAFAQDTTQAAQTQTAEETAAAREREERMNEIVCRREHVVGSNRPQRICQTRREWERLREDSQEQRHGQHQEADSSTVSSGAGR